MKIAIVNDSRAAAEMLRRAVASMPDHQVAWIARDGAEAVENCRLNLPDLILMDLIMPVLDGVEATRRIMAATPCRILVVTATVDANSGKVFEALGAGAVDAVETPALSERGTTEGIAALKFKIDIVGRRDSKGLEIPWADRASRKLDAPVSSSKEQLVVIGASAGGPAAVATILNSLSPDFPAGIVIVQHLDVQFVTFMASWLNEQSKIPVRIALAGDHPARGTALLAGTSEHLTFVSSRSLGYTAEPKATPYRPSVDVFFESTARHWKGDIVAVLLTGMGRDGALGLKTLRDSGAVTIAQDAATSAVYGMPKAAVELLAAVKILPVGKIAAELSAQFPAVRSTARIEDSR